MAFPNDVPDAIWDRDNLRMWSMPKVIELQDISLLPLEAKALHVIGTSIQIFDAASHLLYCGSKPRPYANYCLYAYLLACTAIELLGRCQGGEQSAYKPALRKGLKSVGLETVIVNIMKDGVPTGYTYDLKMLEALRNLVAHGQAVASVDRKPQEVILHVELLDNFPVKIAATLDEYCEELFSHVDPAMRQNLARAAVHPVLYAEDMGQIPYVSPIKCAYEVIYRDGKKPSEALTRTDWQLYNPNRDDRL